MWESMTGKSIMLVSSRLLFPSGSSWRREERHVLQAAAHALQHRRFRRLDPLEIGERLADPRAGHADDAVAVGDDDVARGDGAAAADDRQADRPGPAPARRIRRHAHREDGHAERLEIDEVAHHAVGDEADDAAIPGDAEQEIADDRGAGEAARRGDDDVAGLALRDRCGQREIVVGPAVAGQRDADAGRRRPSA